MATGEVDNGKPPEPQTHRPGDEEAFIIRSAMRNGTCHPDDRFALHWFASLEVKLACDAAHIQRSQIRCQRSEIRDQRLTSAMKEDGLLIMLPSIAPISRRFST